MVLRISSNRGPYLLRTDSAGLIDRSGAMPLKVDPHISHPLLAAIHEDSKIVVARILIEDWYPMGHVLRLELESKGIREEEEWNRYAYRVDEKLFAFREVRGVLTTAWEELKRLHPSNGTTIADLYRLGPYHLSVHRTHMVSAFDTALRLVAAVWNLGVPPQTLMDKRIIYGNALMQKGGALEKVLKEIWSIVEPYSTVRNEILHGGGKPDARHMSTERMYDRARELAPIETGGVDPRAFRKFMAEGVEKETAVIAEEIRRLYEIELPLFDALWPDYQRQRKMLQALAGA